VKPIRPAARRDGHGLFRYCGRLLVTAALGLGRRLYHLEISGAENIPDHGAYLLVGNPASYMDFVLVAFIVRTRPSIHLYGGGWRVPYRGSPRMAVVLRMAGMNGIPTRRESDASTSATLWSTLTLLQQGHPVAIAPEGRIRWDGRLRSLNPGAAWLALRSGAPIVVCVLQGGYSIWPRWANFPRPSGKLHIRVGEPLRVPPAGKAPVGQDAIEAVNRRIAGEMARLEEA